MEIAKPGVWAEVDEQGRLMLPPEVAERFGFNPGARVRIEEGENGLRLHRPVTHLAKIYLEPTNRCNLDCRTCLRNSWEAEQGQMSEETFARILADLKTISPPPRVVLAGLGEPLAHPDTTDMVAQLKAIGSPVEMVTNATLLTEKRSRQLISAGLDVLWVSLDGARPENYADVRLGAELPNVLANLRRFRGLRRPSHLATPEIGIVFVAMKRNIADLPELLALGRSVGAVRFLVTNLLPPNEEMRDEILYKDTYHNITYLPSIWLKRLNLPKMDFNNSTGPVFLKALDSGYNVTFAGYNLGGANDVCTFIESGSLAVGWDGSVSPCPPLLYTHTAYLRGYPRRSLRHVVGNVMERSLVELWKDPEYVAYRERVQGFGFAPCTFCGGCDLSRENQSDCFGNPAPACGGCLWAQAVIRCP